MASYSGTVLSAPVVVGTDLDKFPTHKSEFGKGGWHEVADTTERDAIPAERRTAGMAVFVTGTSKLYTLNADLTTWTEFEAGSSSRAAWGEITGTLSNQTDLNTALGSKLEASNLIQGSNITLTKNGNNVTISATGTPTSTVNWGDITSDMANQTDLQTELNKTAQAASGLIPYETVSEYLTPTDPTLTLQMSSGWFANAAFTPGAKGGLLKGLYSNYELEVTGTAEIELAILDADFTAKTFTARRLLTEKVNFVSGTRILLNRPVWVGANQYVAVRTKSNAQCRYKNGAGMPECIFYYISGLELNVEKPFSTNFQYMGISLGGIFDITSTSVIEETVEEVEQLAADVEPIVDLFKEEIAIDVVDPSEVGTAATNSSVRYITDKWKIKHDGFITKIMIPDNTYTENVNVSLAACSYDADNSLFTIKTTPYAFTITPETTEIVLDTPIAVEENDLLGVTGRVAYNGSQVPYHSYIDTSGWGAQGSTISGTLTNNMVPRGLNFQLEWVQYYNPKEEIEVLSNKIDIIESNTVVNDTIYLGNSKDETCTRPWSISNWCIGRFDTAEADGKITSVEFKHPVGSDSTVLIGAFTKNADNTIGYLQRYVRGTLLANETVLVFDEPLEIHAGEVVGNNVSNSALRCFESTDGSGYFTGGQAATSNQTIGQAINFLSGWPTARVDVRYTYVVSTPVSIYAKENREMINEIVDSGLSSSVSIKDMQKVMCIGSSLTAAYYSPRSASWIERVNDFVDVNLINDGVSGNTLTANMNRLISNAAVSGTPGRDIKPTYIMWDDSANGTETGVAGLIKYRQMKEIVDSYGAKLLMGSEENWASAYNKYEHTQQAFANEVGVPYSPTGRLNEWAYPRNNAAVCPYPVLASGHSSYRAISSYIAHVDMLKALPIYKNVKMFKVRETYKAGSPEITDLAYDTNLQRLWYWTAISPGANTAGWLPGHLDNYDNASYDVPDTTNYGSSADEVIPMWNGSPVSFNKYALIEFILDKVNITKGTFVIKPNITPTAVYIAKTIDTTQVYTDQHIRTSFVELPFESLADGSIQATFENDTLHQYELYDKVRVIVYYSSGAFTLAKPEFKDYDGNEKTFDDTIHYHRRRFGSEIIDVTNPSDESWVKSSGATAAELPAPIANYTLYNSTLAHAELADEGATVTKAFTVDNPGYKKVAIRVVGQIWNKISTIRFQGTEYEDSPYITDTKTDPLGLAAYVATDYDYGTIRVTLYSKIGNEYIDLISKDLTVLPGWTETYFEADLTPDDVDMKIEVKKMSYVDDSYNNDDKPIFIHDVSMQDLNSGDVLEITNYTV